MKLTIKVVLHPPGPQMVFGFLEIQKIQKKNEHTEIPRGPSKARNYGYMLNTCSKLCLHHLHLLFEYLVFSEQRLIRYRRVIVKRACIFNACMP